MDWPKAFEHVLPPLMHDPVTFAVPFFLLFLVIEWAAARKLAHSEGERAPSGAYLKPDAWASIWMGIVSVGTSAVMNGIALFGYAALYVYVAPWQLPANAWYTWVIAILGVDLLYYWYHRMAHRVRLFWATHQAHHSSQYFNFATALRQKWNISGDVFLRALLPLFGVPPWIVFASFSINLIYQYWIHTERIGKLWRPIEFIFNTPSHHRVHHGMDEQYLDKNYGGILIVWDRMFGSFQPETFRPHYGLTKQVDTYNIWKLQTHEYVAIARDVRAAGRWRDRLGYRLRAARLGAAAISPTRYSRPDHRFEVARRRKTGVRPEIASITHCSAARFASALVRVEPSMTLIRRWSVGMLVKRDHWASAQHGGAAPRRARRDHRPAADDVLARQFPCAQHGPHGAWSAAIASRTDDLPAPLAPDISSSSTASIMAVLATDLTPRATPTP